MWNKKCEHCRTDQRWKKGCEPSLGNVESCLTWLVLHPLDSWNSDFPSFFAFPPSSLAVLIEALFDLFYYGKYCIDHDHMWSRVWAHVCSLPADIALSCLISLLEKALSIALSMLSNSRPRPSLSGLLRSSFWLPRTFACNSHCCSDPSCYGTPTTNIVVLLLLLPSFDTWTRSYICALFPWKARVSSCSRECTFAAIVR